MDDYSPAKNLMTMCFTYYYIGTVISFLHTVSIVHITQTCYCLDINAAVVLSWAVLSQAVLHSKRKHHFMSLDDGTFCGYASSCGFTVVLNTPL